MIGTITIISKIGTREKTGSFINNKDNTPVIPPQNRQRIPTFWKWWRGMNKDSAGFGNCE